MRYLLTSLSLLFPTSAILAEECRKDELVAALERVAAQSVLAKEFAPAGMLSRDVRARINEANQRDYDAWQHIKTKEDWEKFRNVRITALKQSLGDFPKAPKTFRIVITKTIEGEGYKIENTVFESRPGLWVTANVYRPAKPVKSMPGILIIHSHHNPKHEGELQDMGVTWARAGCYVLVMDQLGHGERRSHPFNDAKSYAEPFRVSRQDYFFRFNLGMQLSLIGESLIGWMVWDVMRGVDLLLQKPGIDPDKIILLGSVAGGGDPAAVAAALDPRIQCVVPFNFGGPQPETKPLGDDAERTFNYAGGGSWESTRNLPLSARDGFLPWVIVGSVAPRHIIHAHEFAWFGARDPVWKRYQKILGFYDAADRLAVTHGSGSVSGKPPESTHCNNIGPVQRKSIHQAFEKWFEIKAVDSKDRHSAEDLRCLTADAKAALNVKPIMEVLADWAAAHQKQHPIEQPVDHSRYWSSALNKSVGAADRQVSSLEENPAVDLGECRLHTRSLILMSGIRIPSYLLTPIAKAPRNGYPAVLCVCQEGKSHFLKERSQAIAHLLRKGIAVCLVDVRGTGETSPGSGRGRNSANTSLSAGQLMTTGPLLALKLADLKSTAEKLSPAIDQTRIAIWGESFAPVNTPADNVAVPFDVDKTPRQAEPVAGLLALFFANDRPVRAVVSRGSLRSYGCLLESPFVYVPHDAIVPGALQSNSDLPALWAALGQAQKKPAIRIEGPVDGRNRRVSNEAFEKAYASVQKAFGSDEASRRKAILQAEMSDAVEIVKWLVEQLQ
jgi:dienelactone hydrolase